MGKPLSVRVGPEGARLLSDGATSCRAQDWNHPDPCIIFILGFLFRLGSDLSP